MNFTLSNKQSNSTPTLNPNTNKITYNKSQFFRSYSQLLDRHFIQSITEKNHLTKNPSSKKQLKSKTQSQKLITVKKIKQIQKFTSQTNHLISSDHLLKSSDSFFRKTSQIKPNSLQDTTKTSFNSSKIKLNPEKSDKIQKIIASKTLQIQKNSYQNVLLNKKLYQTTVQKNDLQNLTRTLKLQILKEKKYKSKISTQMAKLMNKIEQTDTTRNKVESQRKHIDQQTLTIQKDVNLTKEKNKQLQILSQNNQLKINIEKQLIKELERKIQTTKVSLNQTKTHFNELKNIYQQETKSLSNTKANFQQVLSERQKFFHIVEQSVTNINSTSKH